MSSMGKEERRRAILEFLADSDLALPPKPIYINMRRRGATFGRKTVERHLKDMVEEGLVDRVLEEEGYYAITEDGRRYLEGEFVMEDNEDSKKG